jgi:hypothetical protein
MCCVFGLLQVLWVISTVLAAIACLSSLILLWAALDSGNDNGIFRKFGLPWIPYPQVITMMYLKVRRRSSKRVVHTTHVTLQGQSEQLKVAGW